MLHLQLAVDIERELKDKIRTWRARWRTSHNVNMSRELGYLLRDMEEAELNGWQTQEDYAGPEVRLTSDIRFTRMDVGSLHHSKLPNNVLIIGFPLHMPYKDVATVINAVKATVRLDPPCRSYVCSACTTEHSRR